MTPFDLGKLLWEARIKAAWGSHAHHIIARDPWPVHEAAPQAESHILAIAEARALLATHQVTPK